MNHHCSSFSYNYSNTVFSNTVLPLSADTAESNALVLLVELSRKGLALEDAVVSVIRVNSNAHFHGLPFEGGFGIDSVSGIQGNLVLDVYVSRSGIAKHSAATEFVTIGLASCSVKEPST